MPELLQAKTQFANDILEGLLKQPKTLPSKYFYDAKGDELFRKIMSLPEYYLTRCEFEIFEKQADVIIENVSRRRPMQLIELGAGDGSKTRLLLREFLRQNISFRYFPIDISANALEILCGNIEKELHSAVNIHPLEGEYLEALGSPALRSEDPKLILFLGSNIGNFKGAESLEFIGKVAATMSPGDQLLVGFDLKKDPGTILAAYNDKAGITRQFNLNLLARINRELGADFNIDAFDHFPVYDPLLGAAKSYLVSRQQQEVFIPASNKVIRFQAFEAIYMEISQKFDEVMIDVLGTRNGLVRRQTYTDSKGYFADVLYTKQ